jgi:hypothetical protein
MGFIYSPPNIKRPPLPMPGMAGATAHCGLPVHLPKKYNSLVLIPTPGFELLVHFLRACANDAQC